jgi:hypothetical protein
MARRSVSPLLGSFLLLACAQGASRETAGSDFCASFSAAQSGCDPGTACDDALIGDCEAIRAQLSAEALQATRDCVDGLGTVRECLSAAADEATITAEVEAFALQLCLACGDGSGSCPDDVLAGSGDPDLVRAVRIAQVLDPSSLAELGDECASSDGCAASFEACAASVLGRAAGTQAASCVVDAIADENPDDCDTAIAGDDDDGPGDGGEATSDAGDGGSSDGGSDPTGDSNDDGSDDSGGVCDDEGCPCDAEQPCGGDLVCELGTCAVPDTCLPDISEPNENEDEAYILESIYDNDGYGAGVLAQLDGDADVDWYQYQGMDGYDGLVNPAVSISVLALEVCIYAECLNGLANTTVECPMGSTQQPTAGGRPGCCAAGTESFEISLSCGGWLDDGSSIVWMSVGSAEAGVCQEYTLSYHF